jgi:MFS transporter, DHA1 family, inner membrane transport protein
VTSAQSDVVPQPKAISETEPRTGRDRVPLVTLTIAKLLTNAVLRLAYPFLGDISRGLSISKSSAGQLLGLGELAGLASFAVGGQLDRGRHRRWFVGGVISSGLGALLFALVRKPWALGVGFGLICLGVSLVTSAGHSYLGDQVPYEKRARSIGLYETSWAIALLVGGPLFALAIRKWSWATPFAIAGVLLLLFIPIVHRKLPSKTTVGAHTDFGLGAPRMSVVALTIATSLFGTLASVMTFSTFGPWLEEQHSLKTGGLGFVAMGLGGVELIGSALTAGFGDRIGARKTVAIGFAIMAAGAVVLVAVGDTSRLVAAVGILVLFGGFEFGYVAQLAVISEVGKSRRGTVVGIDHGLVVLLRAGGVALGPYIAGEDSSRFGTVQAWVAALALAGAICVLAGGRLDRLDPVG